MRAMVDKQAGRLQALQNEASILESTALRRAQDLSEVARHAESFLSQLQSRPVYVPPGDHAKTKAAMRLSQEPSTLSEALAVLDQHVDAVGHNLGSSRFFAYIPSGGLYESALADYLAAVTNRYSGVAYASPGSARMEEVLLEWLAGVVGYPAGADGDLTSGGSMAAVSAVITAREAFGIRGKTMDRHVVYLTGQTHHTFRKALHVAGLSDCPIRCVAMDARFRMQPRALERQIEEDRKAGLVPWMVAGSAGTTDTGAVDQLAEIAQIVTSNDAWYHVDAAYGGAFAICEPGKEVLRGLESTDSLILDPHKGFFLPGGVGVVLVRDGTRLYNAYHARGAYMQDMAHETERSPCDMSPELTRPFRALRFWLPFKLFGIKPFAAALEEKMLLARYFQQQVTRIPGAVAGPPPDLSITTFRFVPEKGDADEFNRRLLQAMHDDGRVFLTSTTLNGHFTIRMAILGYNTHLDDVDTALAVIREKVEQLTES